MIVFRDEIEGRTTYPHFANDHWLFTTYSVCYWLYHVEKPPESEGFKKMGCKFQCDAGQ
jgi:hypothetical protein